MTLIPQSNALAEAGESLSELMSRDPESYSQQDLERIIQTLREQRVRWAEAEANGTTRGYRASGKAAAPAKLTSTPAKPEDLGL